MIILTCKLVPNQIFQWDIASILTPASNISTRIVNDSGIGITYWWNWNQNENQNLRDTSESESETLATGVRIMDFGTPWNWNQNHLLHCYWNRNKNRNHTNIYPGIQGRIVTWDLPENKIVARSARIFCSPSSAWNVPGSKCSGVNSGCSRVNIQSR